MKPGWEWLLVLLIVLLLFGAKRLPDTARSLGRSMRILKAETKGLHDDDGEHGSVPTSGGTAAPAASGAPAGSASGGPAAAPPPAALPPAGTPVVQPGGAPDGTATAATSPGQRTDDR